jgi:hypothetical protein
MNQVYVQVLDSDTDGGVMLEFSTGRTVPNFRNFEVKIDDGSWRELVGDRYTVPTRSGRTVVLVRTRNQFGHAGLPSEVWITL